MSSTVVEGGKVVCVVCKRPIPAARPTGSPPAKRKRVTISEPPGEEGVLDELLIHLVDKFAPAWDGEPLSVGADHWRYRVLHWVSYSLLTASPEVITALWPTEEG